jgi:hypothetical protein
MQEASNLISNVGFPIGAFILMWYLVNTTLKDLKCSMDDLKLVIEEKLK